MKTRLINFKVGGGFYGYKLGKTTKCPFDKKTKLLGFPIKVGSTTCKGCEHFSGILPVKQVVECKCEGEAL